MARYWIAIASACLLLAGCSKNEVERTYPRSIEATYAELTRIDLRDVSELGFPTNHIEVDLVPLEMVTWRFMLGDLETGRINARLSRQGDAETAVAVDVDTSRAPSMGALADQQNKIAKGWRIAVMTEKVASTLEGRSFDKARVSETVKEFQVDSTIQLVDTVGSMGQMQTEALDMAARERAFERGEKVDSGLGPYAKAMEQEMRRNAPSEAKPSFAEQQAEKWQQDNQ